jgi:hypothetical protein
MIVRALCRPRLRICGRVLLHRGLPTPVDDLRGVPVLHVACGPWHSIAVVIRPPLLSSGIVYSWGLGTLGQLGLEGVMATNRPKAVMCTPPWHARVCVTVCITS